MLSQVYRKQSLSVLLFFPQAGHLVVMLVVGCDVRREGSGSFFFLITAISAVVTGRGNSLGDPSDV